MSKIHEALEKAARERTRQVAGGTGPTLMDITEGLKLPPVLEAEFKSLKLAAPEIVESSETSDSKIHEYTQPRWHLDPLVNVFLPESGQRVVAERFRTLRSRLHQLSETRKLRTVVVTSAASAEGKSFVCANLVQSLVQQMDRKVLLIDADLRVPTQHKIFGAPRSPGLSNYLRGEAREFEVLQKGLEGNLFLIPAGDEVSNPSELMLSDQMKQLIRSASEKFDWVILDSPPTLPVHDASVLADMSDGVLLVVRAASTDFEVAGKAAEEFRKKNLLGVVLNAVEKGVATYKQQYY